MKKLLITEANTALGQSICAQFDKAAEWDVVATKRAVPSVDLVNCGSDTAEIPGVKEFIAGYQVDAAEFKREVLDADVIICPLSDNIEEAAAAIRMLTNTTFEWEKTFVLVSSTMTWADTYNAQKAGAEAERLEERRALLEAGEELPDEEEEETPEEEEAPVFTEDQYQRRVPHRKFDHWKELERFTKQANSETLHTYVINGGLQYGHGEDVLHHLMRAAWHGQPLPLYTNGANVVPMIHVDDLANMVFKVGSSLDVLSQRYLLGVDKGNCTLGAVVKAIGNQLGLADSHSGDITYPVSEARHHTVRHIEQMTVDLRFEGGTVNELIEEEEWICPDGFVSHIEKVCNEYQQYRKVLPIRAVVIGAPLVGKTHLAEQLSQDYRVNHLKLADMIAGYEAHVADLKLKLKTRRLDKLEEKRLAEKEEVKRAAREAAEEAEAAAEEEDAGAGGGTTAAAGGDDSDEDEDHLRRPKSSLDDDHNSDNKSEEEEEVDEFEDDDETFIDFAIETPENAQSGNGDEEEDGDAEDGAVAAAGDEEDEDEEVVEVDEAADDDEEDEVLNSLKEAIAHATRVLACRVKPHVAEVPMDEDGNPMEPPANASPHRPMMGKPYGDAPSASDKSPRRISVVEKEEKEKQEEGSSVPQKDNETSVVPQRLRDAALATIVRWRIGNRDCRCQGYVLDGFPKTVRQASLTFMVGEGGIPIPEVEEDGEEEVPEEEGEELRELMMAATDDKALPENVFVLKAGEAQLLARCEALRAAAAPLSGGTVTSGKGAAPMTSDEVDVLARFYRRLKEHKVHFSPAIPQPHKNLPNWFRSIMTNTEGNPREPSVYELDTTTHQCGGGTSSALGVSVTAGEGSDDEGNAMTSSAATAAPAATDNCMARVREALGPRRFYRPTPMEIVEEAKQQSLEEERRALAHIHAEEEARRVEAEVQAAKKRETAKHERRYRSIQEEQAEVAATINDMPMQTYLMQYVVPPLTKGIAHCVQLRPEDPVDTLGDFLFDYEPHRKL